VILIWLVVAAGTLAFVIPGFIFSMMFLVTVPVVVIEGVGPVEAMQRSRNLTRGHRLGLFMLILLAGICISLPGIAISFMFFDFGMASRSGWIWGTVSGVYSAVVLLVQFTGLGVIYRGLRRAEAFEASGMAG
jgi:hypothetical protein